MPSPALNAMRSAFAVSAVQARSTVSVGGVGVTVGVSVMVGVGVAGALGEATKS